MRTSLSCVLFLALFFSQFPSFVEAGEASREAYLHMIENFPNLTRFPGDSSQGEIEIILDKDKMADVESKTGVDVGVVAHAKWGWIWINDACRFPDGHEQVFGRFILAQSLHSAPGVAIMPITPDGKVILICTFRHATRSWEVELSRGMVEFGEDIETAAKRETREETGMLVDDLFCLGEIPTDSGLTSTVVPVFMAKVKGKQDTQHEEGEAIEEILALTIQEIKQAFVKGSYECTIRGVKKQVLFRDPMLAYAILMYDLKQPM